MAGGYSLSGKEIPGRGTYTKSRLQCGRSGDCCPVQLHKARDARFRDGNIDCCGNARLHGIGNARPAETMAGSTVQRRAIPTRPVIRSTQSVKVCGPAETKHPRCRDTAENGQKREDRRALSHSPHPFPAAPSRCCHGFSISQVRYRFTTSRACFHALESITANEERTAQARVPRVATTQISAAVLSNGFSGTFSRYPKRNPDRIPKSSPPP